MNMKFKVQFFKGTKAQYDSISPDRYTFYFISDTNQVFLGDIQLTQQDYSSTFEEIYDLVQNLNDMYQDTSKMVVVTNQNQQQIESSVSEKNTFYVYSNPVNAKIGDGITRVSNLDFLSSGSILYDLLVSCAAISKSTDGTYNPSSITLNAKTNNGSGMLANYQGRFVIQTTTDNNTWTVKYTSLQNQATKTYTLSGDFIAVKCSLYQAGNTSVLLSQQIVPVVKQGDTPTLLRVDSSRGTVFKQNQINTVLSVVLYYGGQRITDINTLHQVYGSSAYLQWSWQAYDSSSWSILSNADSRISNNGFNLTLTQDDIDIKSVFQCTLIK